MRIEVTIAKTSPLPAGAIDALAGELPPPICPHFSGNFGNVTLRYAPANNMSVIGASKTVSFTHPPAPQTGLSIVCRLLL